MSGVLDDMQLLQEKVEALEATVADLLAACEALRRSLKQLRGGRLRHQVEEEEALKLGEDAIAKARGQS